MPRGAGSVRRFLPLAVALLLPVTVSGCGLFEDVSGPTTGDVTVTASPSGESAEIDSDGYQVSVVGGSVKLIDPDGSARFEELEEGQRAVDLLGLQFNCSVDGQNPKTVAVESGETTVNFAVSCGPIPPRISNGDSRIQEVNTCSFRDGPDGSVINTSFAYVDEAGDVTDQDATIEAEGSFENDFTFSLDEGFISHTQDDDGSSGTITISACVRFGDSEQWEVTYTLIDALGRKSNPLTISVPRPEGANAVAPDGRPISEPGLPIRPSGGS